MRQSRTLSIARVTSCHESLKNCEKCDTAIPTARREAVPGVRLCVNCQAEHDKEAVNHSGYNRRGSKDSQLR